MKTQSSQCNFDESIYNKEMYIPMVINIALNYAHSTTDISPEKFFSEAFETKKSGLDKDSKKLLFLSFLKLINMPVEDLELLYLETITELEDEGKMAVQLLDFIENSEI